MSTALFTRCAAGEAVITSASALTPAGCIGRGDATSGCGA